MNARNAELDELIAEPRESLDVEVKEWLDLTAPDHRAALAKEIIALANHGGGYLVGGFVEQSDGSFAPADPRPPSLNDWSQDAIQGIIAKYVDPRCSVWRLPPASPRRGRCVPHHSCSRWPSRAGPSEGGITGWQKTRCAENVRASSWPE